MTLAHPDARSWALARSASEEPRLGMLEAVACQAHPDVVATFGDDGAMMAEVLGRSARDAAAARRGLTGLGIVLTIVGVIAPVAGMAVLGAESYLIDRVPAGTAVPLAAVAFAVGAVMLVIAGTWWARSGARWSGLLCGYGVVAALSAGFAVISMPTVSERDGYDLQGIMLLPVWATLLLSILLAGAVLLRFRVRDAEATDPAPNARPTVSARADAEHAARTIPTAERTTILADRDAALMILAERGFIDGERLQRALSAPLGALFTLDGTGGASG